MTVDNSIRFYLINVLLLAVSLWVIGKGVTILREKGRDALLYTFAFRRINIYLFLVMALLYADMLLTRVNQ